MQLVRPARRTSGTTSIERIRKLLDHLEAVAARVALVFVKRHSVSHVHSSTVAASSPSISCRCSQNGAVPCASNVSWKARSENALPCCCL